MAQFFQQTPGLEALATTMQQNHIDGTFFKLLDGEMMKEDLGISKLQGTRVTLARDTWLKEHTEPVGHGHGHPPRNTIRPVRALSTEDIVSVRIFHDGRSCGIPSSDYRAVNGNMLQKEILTCAFKAIGAEHTNPATQYDLIFNMPPPNDFSRKYMFSDGILNNLVVAGITHIDPGSKQGADDHVMKERIDKWAREAKAFKNGMKCLAVIISSDSDMASSVRAAQDAGIRVVQICSRDPKKVKLSYLQCADANAKCWETLVDMTATPKQSQGNGADSTRRHAKPGDQSKTFNPHHQTPTATILTISGLPAAAIANDYTARVDQVHTALESILRHPVAKAAFKPFNKHTPTKMDVQLPEADMQQLLAMQSAVLPGTSIFMTFAHAGHSGSVNHPSKSILNQF